MRLPFFHWSQRDGYTEHEWPQWLCDEREDANTLLSGKGYRQRWIAGHDDFDCIVFWCLATPGGDAPLAIAVCSDVDWWEGIGVATFSDAMALRDILFARYPITKE